jgi:hypothetical protein
MLKQGPGLIIRVFRDMKGVLDTDKIPRKLGTNVEITLFNNFGIGLRKGVKLANIIKGIILVTFQSSP